MTLTAPTGWEARVEAAPSSQGRAGGWRVHVRREGDGVCFVWQASVGRVIAA